MREYLTSGQVGALLGVSRERVLQLIGEGRLKVAAHERDGRRLFTREAVEHLAAERRQQQEARDAER
jgi:excisionase family DNA binding protein